jgi:hypothetical protein
MEGVIDCQILLQLRLEGQIIEIGDSGRRPALGLDF